ncbi:MAG: hypothetical protein K5622_05815 [Endomicrobiaceae bacterium]|nr:hypothetical protein [Endomicrobiaceae bacterium]
MASLDKNKSVKVIISGGFHTEGVNALLDKNKISYITLTPNVKENDSLYEQKYLDSIVEQAEVDTNAIAKRPFLEQNSQIIINNIVSSMDAITKNLEAGKSLKEVEDIINGVIKANSLEEFVNFNIDDNGFATITVDNKTYTLSFEKGKVVVQNNFSTTLAKNIKTLIKEALEVASIRRLLGLKKEYNETLGVGFNQEAEYFFMKHNILFPGFADICLDAIVRKQDVDVKDKSNDKVYQALLDVKENFTGEEFSGKIYVGRSPLLIGARPDGYGNTEEYGSLFYVEWEETDGVYKAKEILISRYLLDNLRDLSEQELKEFFVSLFIHERLEMLALTGESEKFNNYVLKNKLSKNSEVFHQYIKSSDFNSFLSEQGMSSDNLKEQRALLDKMDAIISKVNKENSQYSNIISVSSLEEGETNYSEYVLKDFLAIRAGEKKTIDEYNSKLAKKVASQIEKEFILEQKTNNPDFNIEKDFDAEKLVEFINTFAVVYRKSNSYIGSEQFAGFIKKELLERYSRLKKYADAISIQSYELEEDSNGDYILKNFNKLNENRMFFIEDIISKQSETFNDIYNYLMSNNAKQVQGLAFFDLSKESKESSLITESAYNKITEEGEDSSLFTILKNVNGNIQKYFAYWLVSLYKDANGQDILKKIASMDKQVVDNLMTSLMNMIKEDDLARNVKCYEIVNLMLFIGFGEKKDINSITKAEMDEFIKKYDFRIKDKENNRGLSVSYDDWKESIASLILYAYMSGYDYIDASKINDLTKKYSGQDSSNKEIVTKFCKEFNISFLDEKTKLKHTNKTVNTDDLSEQIQEQKQKLEQARKNFENKAQQLNKTYNAVGKYEIYLTEMEKLADEYRKIVKEVMLSAKDIVIKKLASQNMKIDDSLFAIIIGGSLVKGNMMSYSDIYYDIIVPDGTISKSIDKHFAPLYSSVLQEIGLKNYYVLKYSTTNMNRRNINTFVDEKDIAPFLNYAPLSDSDSKKNLFVEYRNKMIEDIKEQDKESKQEIKQNLSLITKKYSDISQTGKDWLGNSFHVAYADGKSFSERWTLMAFESKLNEIIFDYILSSNDNNITVPVSVKEQIEFIRQHNLLKQEEIDKLEFSWNYISAGRYIKENNKWIQLSEKEIEEIENINKFITPQNVQNLQSAFKKRDKIIPGKVVRRVLGKEGYDDLLSKVETLVYDNSTNLETYRRGYDKYSHLETWKISTENENEDIFVKAQIIALLVEIYNPEIKEKLQQLVENTKYKSDINSIIESIETIKLIDEKFPDFSAIEGERSIQNYWDAVAVTAKNPETLFALIAHKLTKAQSSTNVEDQLLLYSVYLPLSKRFGNPDIYEYVRNDSFECAHSVEYLNILNIISSLHGISYSQIKENNSKLREKLYGFFIKNGLDMDKIEIKMRVKSLYSIYEKLNSSRKKDDKEIKPLSDEEKDAIKFVLNSDEFFKRVEKYFSEDKSKSSNEIKETIREMVDNEKELSKKEKEKLAEYLGKIRNAVFSDYFFIEYARDKLNDILDNCKDAEGLVDIEKVNAILEKGGDDMAIPRWIIKIFGGELKDLIGFHVVIKDDYFDEVKKAVNTTAPGDDKYSEIKKFFAEGEEGIKFQYFDKDSKNKQEREKINALIKMENGLPAPVELCLYKETDYEAETYGVYNLKKVSSPHYIYKMGKRIGHSFFENVFSKEINYDFIDSAVDKKKRMIFVADGFVPTENLADNFNKIMDKISGNITCFVEYEDGIYIQKMPKDSTVFDLATGKYFADDANVAVYLESGDQITSDFRLDDTTTYKIIKRDDFSVSLPEEQSDIHTKRAELMYHRMSAQKENFISRFIKSVGKVSDINEFIKLFEEEEFRRMLDSGNYGYSDIADKIFTEKSKNSENKIFKDKELITEALSLLFSIISSKDCKNILPSQFMKRSTQIANHYNLANLFELFETIEYGMIDFNEIKPFYNMCFVIETKSENLPVDKIKAYFDAEKVEGTDSVYNLVINNEKFFSKKLPLLEADSIQKIIDDLNSEDIGLDIENIVYKNKDRIEKEKNKIFAYADFVQPKQEFPLMSLGNNVETLVKHAMMHHSRLVTNILAMTGEIAQKYEIMPKNEENITALINEDPGLMAQVLMGLFSQDTYEEQELLSQATPFLTQQEVNFIKDVKNMDFSEYADLLEKYKINSDKIKKDFSNINLKVSRSFDLHIDKEDVFSFATVDVDSEGTATLYVSETLLRELSKLSEEERQLLLEQLVLHEIMEKEILSLEPNINYENIHKEFEQYEGQRKLMEFVNKIVYPNASGIKNALFEEIDALLEQNDFAETDSKTTIALMFGNLNIDSFINTYKAYRDKKVGRIFISGNTRGSIAILKVLRNTEKHSEYKSLLEGIKQNADISSIRTVKDLLSLSDEDFQKLTFRDLETVPARTSKVNYLDETSTAPVSKDEIFALVSEDGVTEAAIIKWVMLESARKDGLTRKEINDLIRAMSLETKASNTLQNIENIFAQQEFIDFISGKDNIDLIVIQNPFSQTRAKATLNKYLHSNMENSTLQNKKFSIHSMKFDNDSLDYYNTGDKLIKSVGEWTRLIAYSLKGDIIPAIGSQEGLNAVPLEILIKVLSLMPVLTDKEKGSLKAVFTNISESKGNIKRMLQDYADKNKIDKNKYDLIDQFIDYLYSDTAEQRQLEKTWKEMQPKDVLPDLVVQEQIVIDEKVANTHKILSAA